MKRRNNTYFGKDEMWCSPIVSQTFLDFFVFSPLFHLKWNRKKKVKGKRRYRVICGGATSGKCNNCEEEVPPVIYLQYKLMNKSENE